MAPFLRGKSKQWSTSFQLFLCPWGNICDAVTLFSIDRKQEAVSCFQSKTCFDHHAKKESRVIWYDSGNKTACLIGQNTLGNFRHDFTSCQRTWKSPPTRKVTRGGKVDCMFIYKLTHGERPWKDWNTVLQTSPNKCLSFYLFSKHCVVNSCLYQ